MAMHDCETFDFPDKFAKFKYTITTTIPPQFGGTRADAMKEVMDNAKDQANTAAEAAMKGETCADPCDSLIYVEVHIKDVSPKWKKTKDGDELTATISGNWEAGILCFKRAAKGKK